MQAEKTESNATTNTHNHLTAGAGEVLTWKRVESGRPRADRTVYRP